jgi:hypothetical protein
MNFPASLFYVNISQVGGVDGRIILEWIFKNWDVGVRTGLGSLRIGL